MNVAIIAPTRLELEPFENFVVITEKFSKNNTIFHSGELLGFDHNNKCNIVMTACGIGKVNAAMITQTIIDSFNPDFLILSGVAGALDESLQFMDVVVAETVEHHDFDHRFLSDYYPFLHYEPFRSNGFLLRCAKQVQDSAMKNPPYFGKIVTGESFVTNANRKPIIEKLSPLCVDMESAAFAQVCIVNSAPFIVIRAISDGADDDGMDNFVNNVSAASVESARFTTELIKLI